MKITFLRTADRPLSKPFAGLGTAYILDTFPIVRRKDEAHTAEKNSAGEVIKPGRYITKDTILEIYDALAESMKSGQPYQTRLDPPPGDMRACHSPKPADLSVP